MIPVTNKNYEEFDLNKKELEKKEKNRIELLKNQLRYLNLNKKRILTQSKLLYNLYKEDKLPKNVKDRCCNFLLLEEKCKEYKNILEWNYTFLNDNNAFKRVSLQLFFLYVKIKWDRGCYHG